MAKRKVSIPVYYTSLEIENVRCFGSKQRLDLTTETGRPARWTLILGDNGVGKTTLLQCLAWMRLVPASGSESITMDDEDDSAGPAPITKGWLGPALLDEENDILEGLRREGRYAKVSLGATLSYDGRLMEAGEDTIHPSQESKQLNPRVELTFTRRQLAKVRSLGRTRIEKKLGGQFHDPVVVAYGANRQLGTQNLTTAELDDPIASRLAGPTTLYDVEEILTGLDYAARTKKTKESAEQRQLNRVREVLAKMLPGTFAADDIKIFPPDVLERGQPSGVHLQTFSGVVKLSALSLGYQTTLAWTVDLAWRLLKRYPHSENPLAEPAVVLIDEIDLHLHPQWQLRIIDDLSAIFPATQFVSTAHSPLMVQVAESANLVLLRQRHNDVEIVNDPEVVRSWRVDQILTSQLFEIPRARNKQTEKLFARRDQLLDKSVLSATERVELERLRFQISELPTAQDPDDDKAMAFIRQAAALLRKKTAAAQ